MLRLIITAFALTFVTLSAQAQVYCDDYGNCSGITESGEPINTYTDDYGNTSGMIGDEPVSCYTDDYGNTTCF